MSAAEWIRVALQAWSGTLLLVIAVYVSYAVSSRHVGKVGHSVLWAAVALVFSYLATVSFHALTSLTAFRMRAALLAGVVGAFFCHLAMMPFDEFARRAVNDIRDTIGAFLNAAALVRVALALIVTLFALPLSKAVLIPPLGWDAVSYHMAKAAMWVQHGRLQTLTGPGGWSYFPLFPGGGDLLYAWAMLPFRSDLLACLAGGAVWIATGLATYALARASRVTRLGGAAASVLVMFTPAVLRITASGYVEPVLQLYTALTAICAVEYFEKEDPRWLALALAGAGLMAGVKVMGLVLGGVTVAWLTGLLIARNRRAPKHWLAWGIGLGLALLAVGPWWWRAMIQTGRPLSPIPMRIMGFELGRINPDLQWLQIRPSKVFSIQSEWQTLKALFAWNPDTPSLGGVWAILFILLPLAVWRAQRLAGRAPAIFLTALIAAFLVGYYNPEMLILRTHWPTSNARYWIQILPLAAVLLTAGAETLPRGRVLWAVVVFAFLLSYSRSDIFWGVSGVTLSAMPWVATGAWAVGLLLSFMVWRRWWIELAILAFVGIPLVTVRLADYRDATRWQVYRDEGTKSYHGLLRYWVNAAEYLDQVSVTNRIAVTSAPWQNGDNWLVYPFLGRRFQNELLYVPISESGEVVPFDGTTRYLEMSHPAAWIARLYRNGVTHVMSFWPPSIEGYWMLQHPPFFEPISVSRKWGGCFRLRPWSEARRLLEKKSQ